MPDEPDLSSIDWYHTIELPGAVTTKGLWDERRVVRKLPMPASLEGLRCIDVAAADGFFSFEMARRDADFVLSTDLDQVEAEDWQAVEREEVPSVPGRGRAWRAFNLAQESLAYPNIERVDVSVYDLDPEVHGQFDFAFMGNILLHLSDPARAVRAVRGVLKPGGRLLSLEPVSMVLSAASMPWPVASLSTSDEPRWWTVNVKGHRRIIQAGGFEILDVGFPVFQHMGQWRPRFPRRLPRSMRELTFWLTRNLGLGSSWVLAHPRPVRRDRVATTTGLA